MKPILVFTAVVALLYGVMVPSARTIPVFARKYGTSCLTCHVAPPKLNSFGVAFRNNGYRMPAGDEALVKNPDLELGSPEWRRLFPEAVWPGGIPSQSPLALRIIGDLVLNPTAEVTSSFVLPKEIELLAGGTLGEGISFWGEIEFEDDELSIPRAFITFGPLVGTSLLNLTVGRYEPRVVPFSRFWKRLTASKYLPSTFSQTPDGFRFGDVQQGLELWGALTAPRGGGVEYALGLVNGSGPAPETNGNKDTYLRLSYKFGGEGVAAPSPVGERVESLGRTITLQERALRVGLFSYFGDQGNREESGHFQRFGLDLDLLFDRLNLYGLLVHAKDDDPGPNSLREFDALFLEGDYALFPWVYLVLRYERADRPERDIQRLVPSLTALIRANVRLVIESEQFLNGTGDSLTRLRLDVDM